MPGAGIFLPLLLKAAGPCSIRSGWCSPRAVGGSASSPSPWLFPGALCQWGLGLSECLLWGLEPTVRKTRVYLDEGQNWMWTVCLCVCFVVGRWEWFLDILCFLKQSGAQILDPCGILQSSLPSYLGRWAELSVLENSQARKDDWPCSIWPLRRSVLPEASFA